MGDEKQSKYVARESTSRARRLRQTRTEAEAILWRRLRDRRLVGAKFRRQHPVGLYLLDFYCSEAKLAIEVDGSQHCDSRQKGYDDARSAYLRAEGIEVVRFSNRDVARNMDAVLQAIVDALTRRFAAPSPRGRGG